MRFLFIESKKLKKQERCWTGYEPVPGKKPYSDGSCKKKKTIKQRKK